MCERWHEGRSLIGPALVEGGDPSTYGFFSAVAIGPVVSSPPAATTFGAVPPIEKYDRNHRPSISVFGLTPHVPVVQGRVQMSCLFWMKKVFVAWLSPAPPNTVRLLPSTPIPSATSPGVS